MYFELNLYGIKCCFHITCKCLPFRNSHLGFYKRQHSKRGFQVRVVVY